MNALKSLVVLVAGMTAASIALAWKEPTVEYSADSYMETSAGVMAGKSTIRAARSAANTARAA